MADTDRTDADTDADAPTEAHGDVGHATEDTMLEGRTPPHTLRHMYTGIRVQTCTKTPRHNRAAELREQCAYRFTHTHTHVPAQRDRET